MIVLSIYLENTVLVGLNQFFSEEPLYIKNQINLKSLKLMKLFRVVRVGRAMPEVRKIALKYANHVRSCIANFFSCYLLEV